MSIIPCYRESLDVYEKAVIQMNAPRVVIDNAVCANSTLVKVDGARTDGVFLEVVRVLTDLDLSIRKAYISSDGRWLLDVFHVTDRYGQKLTDENVISFIERSISAAGDEAVPGSRVFESLTTLELIGSDRPGLLSEIFAVLADLGCSVVEAKLWTHKGRIAALIFVKDEVSGSLVQDSEKLRLIEVRLRNVVRGATTALSSSSSAAASGTGADRRLHQMLFADRDYERGGGSLSSVSIENWASRGYSMVNVQCGDRPKLLFDIVCTLTDMDYVVFHGSIDTTGDRAYQVINYIHIPYLLYPIPNISNQIIPIRSLILYSPRFHPAIFHPALRRKPDQLGSRAAESDPMPTSSDRSQSIRGGFLSLSSIPAGESFSLSLLTCSLHQGLRLELCAADPGHGLLAEATRTFRENGLSVTRAELSTKGDLAVNVFYVTDAAGHPVERKTIEAVIEQVGAGSLKAYEERPSSDRNEPSGLLYLVSLVKRNLYNLGLIRSYT
ncbi:hypothetical protein KSP40_PGU018791 [Platanthera guangdongensis]|uniref:ACT domain-containing protein ACR n=1 Tax=Platanthera guangdongensis TaxID=2320717 RepID=A0ABR2LRB1_9ASPA